MLNNYLLKVQGLKTHFRTKSGYIHAVDGISFSIQPGEKVAIVGESGCGKSVMALSIMRLIPQPPDIYTDGQLLFKDKDLLQLSEYEMRAIRGSQIGMIFQDPMSALNPTMTIGEQIAEGLSTHRRVSASQARKRAIEMLDLVGIPAAAQRVDLYPHQFSGGMHQRVMIAIALVCKPKLLIADEPTTALDVTIQAQILDLLNQVCQELGTALMLITHDLGVVASIADRILVMYAGKIVEEGPIEQVLIKPRHPYTIGLRASVPRLDEQRYAQLHIIEGTPPDLLNPPLGCPFRPRCNFARQICQTMPPLSSEERQPEPKHRAACWVDVTSPMEQFYARRQYNAAQKQRNAEKASFRQKLT